MLHRALPLVLIALTFPTSQLHAQKKNPAATPSPRVGKSNKPEPGWMRRHEGFLAVAKKGKVDVLFLGDSITAGWAGRGKKVWTEHFAPLKAANFGIGGDRTEHVLWRIQNGELEGITPKVAVLMIGTNNSRANTAPQISAGVEAIVKHLRKASPKTHVLLLGIFPRGAEAKTPIRAKLATINDTISKLDSDSHVHYLDIGSKFTEPDGSLTKKIMPDYLHLSEEGYQIWADAILPQVRALLKKENE